jgi:predicted anti-sigma-YlaC factor YlaD
MLPTHATDKALESFSLGVLEGEDLREIEEHLMICEDCRNRLLVADYRISLLRQSLPDAVFKKQVQEIRGNRGSFSLFQKKSSSL